MGKLNVQRITLAAMLASLAGVTKIIFQATTLADYRFSLYEIPLIITGIILGPLMGLVVGFTADWVYAMTFGYGLNLMTVTTMMWGFLAGVFFYKRKVTLLKMIIFMPIASLIAFSINSVQLALWSGWLGMLGNIPIRVAILLLSLPVQVYLVHMIYHRVVLQSELELVSRETYIPAKEKN